MIEGYARDKYTFKEVDVSSPCRVYTVDTMKPFYTSIIGILSAYLRTHTSTYGYLRGKKKKNFIDSSYLLIWRRCEKIFSQNVVINFIVEQ